MMLINFSGWSLAQQPSLLKLQELKNLSHQVEKGVRIVYSCFTIMILRSNICIVVNDLCFEIPSIQSTVKKRSPYQNHKVTLPSATPCTLNVSMVNISFRLKHHCHFALFFNGSISVFLLIFLK